MVLRASALVIMGCIAAQAQTPRPTIAVAPLAVSGATPQEATQIADALATALQGSGKVRLLERAQTDRILAEQGFQTSGACEAGTCALEMGKMLGVERLVIGSIGHVGRTYQLNLRLVEVGTGEVVASSTRQGSAPLDRITRSLVDLASRDLVSGGAPPGDARPQGNHAWIWWGAGALAVVGTTTAVVLVASETQDPPATTPPSPELRMTLP